MLQFAGSQNIFFTKINDRYSFYLVAYSCRKRDEFERVQVNSDRRWVTSITLRMRLNSLSTPIDGVVREERDVGEPERDADGQFHGCRWWTRWRAGEFTSWVVRASRNVGAPVSRVIESEIGGRPYSDKKPYGHPRRSVGEDEKKREKKEKKRGKTHPDPPTDSECFIIWVD